MSTEFPIEERNARFKFASGISAKSMRCVRLFSDPYVYIRGTPTSSVWENSDGNSNVIAILPRCRPSGSLPTELAYVASSTHLTKTSLSALRNLTLTITDKYGELLQFDE